MSCAFDFTLNGERVEVAAGAPDRTLLDWLRRHGRVGSKCGCAEGDCGACTVVLRENDASGKPTWRAINSCIALLPMFAGREVLTVEGLAKNGKLHPVQSCLVKHGGSQCGYCTPGFVMSLFEAYHRPEVQAPWQIAEQLCGNLCRCTGYRPIREAALELLAAGPRELVGNEAPVAAHAASKEGAFLSPETLAELLEMKRAFPEASLVAGATELGVLINKRGLRFPRLISTEYVRELRELRPTPEAWHIGASVTLTALEEALAGEFPALAQMLHLFASRQIRNRATLGGNLVTASPIGDSAPVLLAHDAVLITASDAGERKLLITEFFTGYRQTALWPDEVLKSILLPRRAGGRSAFYKISKRREMDISIVSAAFRVELDEALRVTLVRIAFGGVAATPLRARAAEEAALGRTLVDSRADVLAALAATFQPIDDVRASAGYRREMIAGFWEKFIRGEEPEAPREFGVSDPWPAVEASRQIPHESACGHVTGAAAYVDDVAQRRPMLEVWPVCAPHAHARIVHRDATAARAMPGVRAVLFGEDIPGENNVGVSRKDESLLATEEVLFHGHLVALVVGETLDACRAGAAQVLVTYEALPAIVSPARSNRCRAVSHRAKLHAPRRCCERAKNEHAPFQR